MFYFLITISSGCSVFGSDFLQNFHPQDDPQRHYRYKLTAFGGTHFAAKSSKDSKKLC